MRGRIRLALSVTAALYCVSGAQAADLLEIYQRAQQNDPLVREAEATRLANREARPQAIATLLPQINGQGTWTRDKDDGTTTFTDVSGNTQPSVFVADSESDTLSLQVRQSVFRWENWVALGRSDKQVAQAEADYQAARQDLMLRVAQRYFDVLAGRDTVQSLETARDAIARQLEQADKRFEVGLIAITDVQEAKAARDNATAAVIQAKRNLATAQELLREITGDSADVLEAPGDTMPLMTPSPQSADQWIATALEQNLALISSRLAADIARSDVNSRRGGHFPSIDLVLSQQEFDLTGDQTTGAGTFPRDRDNTHKEISLQVTVPIFSGGATSSQVRQASYQYRAAKERLERTTRQTERETRDAYLGVISEISRVQALKQALESSRTALLATEAGYEVGTRTTVDVLDARRTLAAAETNYARSRYDYLINIVRLKLAAGTLRAEDIAEINNWLEVPAPITPSATPIEPQPSQPS